MKPSSRLKPGTIVHRLNTAGTGVCGAREFVTPGRHAFTMRNGHVTCPACLSRPLRVIHFTPARAKAVLRTS